VGTNGGTQVVDITVEPLINPEALQGMVMVIFADVVQPTFEARAPSRETTVHSTRLAAMARELQQAHADLHATRDDMQTSQEELKSTNEELQSMNEELQSTNEELSTSKEEMQSMNEELQTVNHELQAKVDELSRTSDDMKNLLNSTDIATLFLDRALLVRRFTTQTASIIKLIPGDVGRPITDIVTTLNYPDLAQNVRKVLKTQVMVERQVSAQGGRWFVVRIMPYRTQENQIDGVVVTFADITASKKLEAALRKAQSGLEKRFTRQTVKLGRAEKNLQTKNKQQASIKSKGTGTPVPRSLRKKPR
jgi:two-component system CheB/CheR fusion protein